MVSYFCDFFSYHRKNSRIKGVIFRDFLFCFQFFQYTFGKIVIFGGIKKSGGSKTKHSRNKTKPYCPY
jgi:hypothetical protein